MLNREEALSYANCSAAELADLCRSASTCRDIHWGKQVTYSRKVFLPLTNMCRNDCKYCSFVQLPQSSTARYMTPVEVLQEAERGQRAGCKEALFSLGEKPEVRYGEARRWLASFGHTSTISYLRDMCEMVVEKTGLIPHVNAGAISEDELSILKPHCGSMGMMLENVSRRLTRNGEVHHACPDKVPVQRLRTLEAAGRLQIPFTTGILIGIGETWEERVDSLLAIQDTHQRHGHIQEVIVQNFRAKPNTGMADCEEPSSEEMLKTLAIARLLLDPRISLQAPPNLADDAPAYISAGINDWGGVSPVTLDFINPERPWPKIDELRVSTEVSGHTLRERLTIYPDYWRQASKYVAPNLVASIEAVVGVDGMASSQYC